MKDQVSAEVFDHLQPSIDAVRKEFAMQDDERHIDPETELAQYIDGTLDAADREIVETHLEDCAMCRAEVEDLRAFAALPVRRWVKPFLMSAAAAAAIIAVILLLPRKTDVPPIVTTTTHIVSTTTAPETSVTEPPVRHYAHAEWGRLVDDALRTGRLPMADLRSLTGQFDPLRGTTNDPRARLSPVGVVVDDARPEFTWPATKGATYVVTVFAGEEEVAQSDALSVAHWRPAQSLRRGRTYVWQVSVTSAGATSILPAPPSPSAMFRVTSERDHNDLAEARRLYPDDHLLHAVLAARAGLREEASNALQHADVKVTMP